MGANNNKYMKTQFGFNVRIKFKKDSPFKGLTEQYRNITEIHYNYESGLSLGIRVAFESDIHGTGITQPIKYIEEFEAILETKKEKLF